MPVGGFQWKKYGKFSGRLYKTLYDEYSDKGYVLEVNAEYPENVHDLHNNLPFSPEWMKISECKKTSFYSLS